MTPWDAAQRKNLRVVAGIAEQRQQLVDLAAHTTTSIAEQRQHLAKLRQWLDDGERSLEVLEDHARFLGELLGTVRA